MDLCRQKPLCKSKQSGLRPGHRGWGLGSGRSGGSTPLSKLVCPQALGRERCQPIPSFCVPADCLPVLPPQREERGPGAGWARAADHPRIPGTRGQEAGSRPGQVTASVLASSSCGGWSQLWLSQSPALCAKGPWWPSWQCCWGRRSGRPARSPRDLVTVLSSTGQWRVSVSDKMGLLFLRTTCRNAPTPQGAGHGSRGEATLQRSRPQGLAQGGFRVWTRPPGHRFAPGLPTGCPGFEGLNAAPCWDVVSSCSVGVGPSGGASELRSELGAAGLGAHTPHELSGLSLTAVPLRNSPVRGQGGFPLNCTLLGTPRLPLPAFVAPQGMLCLYQTATSAWCCWKGNRQAAHAVGAPTPRF